MSQILIVDDEESIRFTLASFLNDAGHQARAASTVAEAFEALRPGSFDMIFADIALPDGSGIEILRKLRDEGSRTQVVIITGYPEVETAAQAVRLGAFDYLVKPVTAQSVLRTAQMAIRHKELEDEKEKYRSNLDAIFRSIKDAIISVDAEMRITEINGAAMRMCGFTREVAGTDLRVAAKGCSGHCIEALETALRTRESVEIDRIECHLTGRPRYVVNLTACPLLDRNSRFRGAVLVFRDETRLADMECELRELKHFHRIMGQSRKMQVIYAQIGAVAQTPATVLITGESGTGKELIAEALHFKSARNQKPFVKVNCSALPESLLESELFGHVKGAFTGAYESRTGRFQRADGGTILLDEIGDISPRIQLGLLRVLQEREIERVGDPRPIKLDVWILAATNRNLQEKVRRGEFREDLYYRLKVVEITPPPLRERKDDIPILTAHFLEKFNKRYEKNISGVSAQAKAGLQEYSWPGNVRELEHAIEHAFVFCRHNTIGLDHLPADLSAFIDGLLATPESPEEKIRAIMTTLQKTGGNKAKAARILGIDRKTLYRKMKTFREMPARRG